MSRSVLIAALLVAFGLAVILLSSGGDSVGPQPEESRSAAIRPPPGRGFGAVSERPKPQRPRADFERQAPVGRRAEELPERRRSEQRAGAGSKNLAARRSDSGDRVSEPPTSNPAPGTDEPSAAEGRSKNAGVVIDYSKSALERALTEAGLPPAAAADVKRRYDELAMDEVSLRNLATREGWADSPRYAEELDAIEADRLAIRDEIGDEAYDHYLFATGQPNRVYVTDVMANSPAAQAGLQTSDVIISYGAARILTPSDLIAETEVGTVGEPIRLRITRNGKPLEVEIPRGPLGLRIGVTQEPPSKLAR